jgi:hypothetical protein
MEHTVDEFVFVPKEDRAMIAFHRTGAPPPPYNHHFVVRIRLDGHVFAVDVAGAQYGHYKTVTPWDTNTQDLLASEITIAPAGTTRAEQEAFVEAGA